MDPFIPTAEDRTELWTLLRPCLVSAIHGATFISEKGVIDQEHASIAFHSAEGTVPLPVASLSTLMLGPGTSITHSAVRTSGGIELPGDLVRRRIGAFLCDRNWGCRAFAESHPPGRLGFRCQQHVSAVCRAMYAKRFAEPPEDEVTIEQLRGFEGQRVRQAYADASRRFGIHWTGP